MSIPDLSAFPSSHAIAEHCAAAGIPAWEALARLAGDRPERPNDVAMITGNMRIDETEFEVFRTGCPKIGAMLEIFARRLCWYNYAPRLTGMPSIPRGGPRGLFMRPDFAPGGILENVMGEDEVYFLPTLAQLTELMGRYRDAFPTYIPDREECNPKADRILGDIKKLQPGERPAFGWAVISAAKGGVGYIHKLNFAATSDAGQVWVQNSGAIYPMGRAFEDLSEIRVLAGAV